ncbi:hypothetical protein N9Z27_01370 [Alphaproteobacteria bacterium]|nr:hypothetical protein [Alphaproteobacteria bacterium]
MATVRDGQIFVSTHEFKTSFSKLTAWLEEGRYRAVVVRRYNRDIGVYISNHSVKLYKDREAIRSGKILDST